MKKRIKSAVDLGKPEFLARTTEQSGKPRLDDLWAIDWNLSCNCGGASLFVCDFIGKEDEVDTPFWTQCEDCESVLVAFQPGENSSDLEFDANFTCKVTCSNCSSASWRRLIVGLYYNDDLVDEAIESGNGIESLKDQFWWLNLNAVCKCGHECQLATISLK